MMVSNAESVYNPPVYFYSNGTSATATFSDDSAYSSAHQLSETDSSDDVVVVQLSGEFDDDDVTMGGDQPYQQPIAFAGGYSSFFGASTTTTTMTPSNTATASVATSVLRFGGAHGCAGFESEKERGAPVVEEFKQPTDILEMRKIIRQNMHRCKVCKNRFIEKDIYVRHLRDKHPERYDKYMEEQAQIMQDQRLAELENIRREEIKSGGFIMPAREIELAEALADPNEIRLPEESDQSHFYIRDERGLPVFRRKTRRKRNSPQCPFCDKRFRNDNSLKKHVAKKHTEFINFVQCNKCFKCLASRDQVGSHACELIYVCWECTPAHNMVDTERLEQHRLKFHRGVYSGFKCPDCPRKFLTPRKLRKHRKMTHIVKKPYKCHFCDEYFPTDTQAALHERIHTGKIKFECNVCDYRTNRFKRLHEHKRNEHGYICVICNEKTVEYAELKYHTLEKHCGYLSSESQAVCIESPRVWVLFKGE